MKNSGWGDSWKMDSQTSLIPAWLTSLTSLRTQAAITALYVLILCWAALSYTSGGAGAHSSLYVAGVAMIMWGIYAVVIARVGAPPHRAALFNAAVAFILGAIVALAAIQG